MATNRKGNSTRFLCCVLREEWVVVDSSWQVLYEKIEEKCLIVIVSALHERNGIARSLSVMPGDKIDMQVFGKYYDPNTPQTNQTAWDNLVGLITQVANAAQTVVVDGVGYTSGSLRLPPATGVLTDPNESAAYPKAHLNWATFDRDWKFLDGGAKQLQGGAEDGTDVPFAEISTSIEIKEPGYVYIWLSNTSAQQRDVFFDDFKVVHTKSPVVQQEEYYPFGLAFNSYSRENSIPQDYQYNGKENRMNWVLIGWTMAPECMIRQLRAS